MQKRVSLPPAAGPDFVQVAGSDCNAIRAAALARCPVSEVSLLASRQYRTVRRSPPNLSLRVCSCCGPQDVSAALQQSHGEEWAYFRSGGRGQRRRDWQWMGVGPHRRRRTTTSSATRDIPLARGLLPTCLQTVHCGLRLTVYRRRIVYNACQAVY